MKEINQRKSKAGRTPVLQPLSWTPYPSWELDPGRVALSPVCLLISHFFKKKKVNSFEEQENLPEPSEATGAVRRPDSGAFGRCPSTPSGNHGAAPQMPQQCRSHRRPAPSPPVKWGCGFLKTGSGSYLYFLLALKFKKLLWSQCNRDMGMSGQLNKLKTDFDPRCSAGYFWKKILFKRMFWIYRKIAKIIQNFHIPLIWFLLLLTFHITMI